MEGKKTFTVAIEGCCHGELDNIYGTLQVLQEREGKKVDLLICCGDFQAVRNYDDLECLACPPKYRQLMTFHKYYSGERKAPIPTLFIGGNHEATNHLWELHYGGWVAPNIFFMGYAGALRFGGQRIAGLSGVYVPSHYTMGHWEQPPYDQRSIKSAYHVRQLHAYRLMQLKQPVDVFLSHDWPKNIEDYGNKAQLLKYKPFLRAEMERGEFGSLPGQEILHCLQPSYWFAAHMHTKFPALVPHPGGTATRFLALDKCLPGRDFLQVLELPLTGPLEFEYDAEWLAVLRSTHDLLSLRRQAVPLPAFGNARAGARPEDLDFVNRVLSERGAAIPHNFSPTAPAHGQPGTSGRGRMPQGAARNPQTLQLLEMLGLPYNLEAGVPAAGAVAAGRAAGAAAGPSAAAAAQAAAVGHNPEEIDIDEEEDEGEGEGEDMGGEERPVLDDAETAGTESHSDRAVAAVAAEEEDEMFRPISF